MANLIREKRLIKSDYVNNNNKFWYIFEYDDATVRTENGRVGKKPQTRPPKQFGSQSQASADFDKQVATKLKDGRNGEIPYKELKTLEGSGGSTTISTTTGNLAQVATDEIEFNCPEVAKLIKYLSKQNIHNIVSNTNITYNKQSGLFETPCGIITQDGIDEARSLLVKLAVFMEKQKLTGRRYGKLLNEYLMLIPQDIGMRFNPETLYTSMADIQKQEAILVSLEASLQQVLTAPKTDDDEKDVKREKTFNLKLHKVTDDAIIDRINKKYRSTHQGVHACSGLKVKTVYTVEIGSMHEAFVSKGKKVGNVMELWHGTRVANLLSILKGGLMIPPSSAGHCTGRMFGDGVYFSDQSTKSLNYSYGYWGHGSADTNCFMFLADVAMGKYWVPSNATYDAHNYCKRNGYDSCFAKGRQSGVGNNEMIVYNTNQCDLTYLIEFSK